ncbi:hypothetical protein DN402_09635 [Streptomyces sp. SW4]|nr:hypothetical protein DN402_09635 [Streptomyces sp. SW4]
MGLPGTSVLAAAATYAGIQVRGTLKQLHARLLPRESVERLGQEVALDTASMSLVARMLDDTGRSEVARETLELAERVMHRLAQAPPVAGPAVADLRDDTLLTDDEAATLILGLQDRTTRDRAAAWMEGDEAGPALRLWRALARRCVGPYGEHAAAPLTLAGWVAWSTGDELEAREALAMALGADPDYLFARLLHQACNEGLDPESIRRCLRAERGERTGESAPTATLPQPAAPTATPSPPASRTNPTRAGRRRRTRAGTPAEAGRRRARTKRTASGVDGTRPRTTPGQARPGGTRPGRATGPEGPRTRPADGPGACSADGPEGGQEASGA